MHVAFKEHVTSGIESHSKFMSECGKISMSVRTEKENFHDVL